jgi:hypothetical protein
MRTEDMSDEKLLKAAVNASNTIHAIYQWVEKIEAAGGARSISGVAACHAFLESMKKQGPRIDSLVMAPLEAEINARKAIAD